MPIALVYTTFPKRSETFLQREARALLALGVPVRFYSILGGAKTFEGHPVTRLSILDIFCAIAAGLFYIFTPRRFVWSYVLPHTWRGWTNWGENLLGLAAGITWANSLSTASWRHAQWGTGPAMALLVARRLMSVGDCSSPTPPNQGACSLEPSTAPQLADALKSEIPNSQSKTSPKCEALVRDSKGGTSPFSGVWGRAPLFSMGLHAYDLFAKGGDGWLAQKVEAAAWISSSNRHAHEQVKSRWPQKTAVWIRRGVELSTDAVLPAKVPARIIKIITVGRLVAKKGLGRFLTVLQHFNHHGIEFDAEIIGDGPLREKLSSAIVAMGLGARVTLTGWLAPAAVAEKMKGADFFFFTGEISQSGDRDGFPNVIGEAFAAGCVVIAREVGGVSEGVTDGVTGRLITEDKPIIWREAVEKLLKNPDQYQKLRANAFGWVKENFCATANAQKILKLWQESAAGK